MSARTSDAARAQVIAVLRAGSTAAEAARLAGVSHATAVRIARAEGLAGPVGRPVGDADPVTQEVVALLREGLASGSPLPDLAVLSAKAETALRVAEGTYPLRGRAEACDARYGRLRCERAPGHDGRHGAIVEEEERW